MMPYEYLIASSVSFLIWICMYSWRKDLRRKMIFGSLIALPFGLTEFFFVPSYWHPHTLLGMRFDIESLIFMFSAGGIASCLYEVCLHKHLKAIRILHTKQQILHHAYYLSCIGVSAFVLSTLVFPGNEGPMFVRAWSTAGILMALTLIYIRRDLMKPMLFGGLLFLLFYILSLGALTNILFPGWIAQTWDVTVFAGYTFWGIPGEELLFGLSLGLLWSGLYEYILGYRDA